MRKLATMNNIAFGRILDLQYIHELYSFRTLQISTYYCSEYLITHRLPTKMPVAGDRWDEETWTHSWDLGGIRQSLLRFVVSAPSEQNGIVV